MPESPVQPASDLCQAPAAPAAVSQPLPSLLSLIFEDLRAKARWRYERSDWKAIVKVVLADGTAAMILYRLMQWSRKYRLFPLEMFFNKVNGVCCSCIIGRGAEFGPGFVLLHSQGVVINGQARGGSSICLEHQVTIGAERNQNPRLGDNIYVGCGARILGAVNVGDGARIGANAVVVQDVPQGATVVGIPARVVRQRAVADVSDEK
jgi:serine O-acetyltransferase